MNRRSIRQGNKYWGENSFAGAFHSFDPCKYRDGDSPIVGNEQQAEDLIQYIKNEEKMEGGIWKTSIFGKTVEELVMDGLKNKMAVINEESRKNFRIVCRKS